MQTQSAQSLKFSDVARRASCVLGTPSAFAAAAAVVVLWAVTGPLFGYSDTWQLVINTGTTIVTFLMVFLVQHTQNRDARALHLKMDELRAAWNLPAIGSSTSRTVRTRKSTRSNASFAPSRTAKRGKITKSVLGTRG